MSYSVGKSRQEGFSDLACVNSATKLLCLCFLISAIVHCDCVIGFAVAAVVSAAIIYISSLPVKVVFEVYRKLAGFFILIFLFNTLFFTRQRCLASWWIFSPSSIGAVKGFAVVLKSMLITAVFEVFASSVKIYELSETFALILSPLRFVGIPAAKLSAVISESVCLIPRLLLFSKEINAYTITTESSGGNADKSKIIRKSVMMMTSALNNAQQRAEYLESRGMGLDGKCVPYYSERAKQLGTGDLYAFIVCASLWALEVLVL